MGEGGNRIATLRDAIALVRRLFPKVTRESRTLDGAMSGLPHPLVELYTELGGAIGTPIEVHPTRIRGVSRVALVEQTRFLQTQDELVPRSKLARDDDGRWVIAIENQNSWDWRVEQTSGDTPVLSACADEDLFELRVVNPSLDDFLQGFLLREAIFGSKFSVSLRAFDADAKLEPLKLGCRVAGAPSDFYFSQVGDVLINHEAGNWWFGSNSADPWLTLGLEAQASARSAMKK